KLAVRDFGAVDAKGPNPGDGARDARTILAKHGSAGRYGDGPARFGAERSGGAGAGRGSFAREQPPGHRTPERQGQGSGSLHGAIWVWRANSSQAASSTRVRSG